MIGTAGLENDLSWYFNEAEGEIKQLRSTWIETIRKDMGRSTAAPEMRCGPIYVHSGQHGHHATFEMNHRALAAAAHERRIGTALGAAIWTSTSSWSPPDATVHDVLRLRFRELLPECRIPFGLVGFAVRRPRPLDVQRQVNVRGAGNLAHLTQAALEAWRRERTTRDLFSWVDQLGRRLSQGKAASPAERVLGTLITQQCAGLELRALTAYGRARQRVPARVVRAALARAV